MTTDPSSEALHKKIQRTITKNPIVLYMKGTPETPLCGFSAQVVKILDKYNASYHSINILENEDLRAELKVFSNWPTYPQLYAYGEFVGGCDIVMNLEKQGSLKEILQDPHASEN